MKSFVRGGRRRKKYVAHTNKLETTNKDCDCEVMMLREVTERIGVRLLNTYMMHLVHHAMSIFMYLLPNCISSFKADSDESPRGAMFQATYTGVMIGLFLFRLFGMLNIMLLYKKNIDLLASSRKDKNFLQKKHEVAINTRRRVSKKYRFLSGKQKNVCFDVEGYYRYFDDGEILGSLLKKIQDLYVGCENTGSKYKRVESPTHVYTKEDVRKYRIVAKWLRKRKRELLSFGSDGAKVIVEFDERLREIDDRLGECKNESEFSDMSDCACFYLRKLLDEMKNHYEVLSGGRDTLASVVYGGCLDIVQREIETADQLIAVCRKSMEVPVVQAKKIFPRVGFIRKILAEIMMALDRGCSVLNVYINNGAKPVVLQVYSFPEDLLVRLFCDFLFLNNRKGVWLREQREMVENGSSLLSEQRDVLLIGLPKCVRSDNRLSRSIEFLIANKMLVCPQIKNPYTIKSCVINSNVELFVLGCIYCYGRMFGHRVLPLILVLHSLLFKPASSTMEMIHVAVKESIFSKMLHRVQVRANKDGEKVVVVNCSSPT